MLGVAQARAADQVDRDALGEHAGHPPGPRPDRSHEDGRQARRHDHRLPRQDPGRLRRLQHDPDAADPVTRSVRDGRLLRDPERPDRHHRRVHQQVPDRRDSRRRPARGDAHDRADARRARPRARDGPARDPAQELHPHGHVPGDGRNRRDLRLGRLPQDARQADGARRRRGVPARAGRSCGPRASTAESASAPTPRSADSRPRASPDRRASASRPGCGSRRWSASTTPAR